VSRRLIEEATTNRDQEEIMVLRFFDIEKAYPRVCREALWQVMSRRGAPDAFINVCKALHEHTGYRVRIHEGESSRYIPDKGLREGCPSSPVLFNIYHDVVMEDFRARRAEAAERANRTPGINWEVKIDGKVVHNYWDREHLTDRTEQITIGDFGFADDTGIVGEVEEAYEAEKILCQTMQDWREKMHPGKTEGLRITSKERNPLDVRNHAEKTEVRHVGGILQEHGGAKADNAQKIRNARLKTKTNRQGMELRGQNKKQNKKRP